MILFGQILLIVLYILLELRTSMLRKVDINRRVRNNLPPYRELYKGRILYYLFEFDKIDESDSKEDLAKIRTTNFIDILSFFCLLVFITILLYLVFIKDYSLSI